MGCGRDGRLAIVMRCGGLKSYWIPFLCHVQKGNKAKMELTNSGEFVNDFLTNKPVSASHFFFSCV